LRRSRWRCVSTVRREIVELTKSSRPRADGHVEALLTPVPHQSQEQRPEASNDVTVAKSLSLRMADDLGVESSSSQFSLERRDELIVRHLDLLSDEGSYASRPR
jgi:hypothetical protein